MNTSVRLKDQRGIAMFVAVLVLMLVTALIAVFFAMVSNMTSHTRSQSQQAQSLGWVTAANQDLAARLQAYQVGKSTIVSQTASHELWKVTAGGAKIPLSINTSSGVQKGYYTILAPYAGAPAGTGAYTIQSSNPNDLGTVTFVIQGWMNNGATDTRAQTEQTVFRRDTLSRFAVLSNDRIDVGALGSNVINGDIHTNYTGSGTAVWLGSAHLAGGAAVTTTSGGISGSCGSGCHANTHKQVSLSTIDDAFATVDRLANMPAATRPGGSGGGSCAGTGNGLVCEVNTAMSWAATNYIPVWRVQLGVSGGRCVAWYRAQMPRRFDSGWTPAVDDTRPPSNGSYAGTFCPARGGGALLFNGDVMLQGSIGSNGQAVSIFAQRRGTTTVRESLPNGSSARTVSDTQAASIFLVSDSSVLGSTNIDQPLGVVAEGSIYLPAFAMASSNRQLRVQYAALSAEHGQLSFGPAEMYAAGNTAVGDAGGIDPCALRQGTAFDNLKNAYGESISVLGSVASNHQPIVAYTNAAGSASCTVGYGRRHYDYDTRLAWDPPPLFPTDAPWHVDTANQVAG